MIHVTALICTRNRPRLIREAVRSLLADADDTMELIVLDQSPGADTEQALLPWIGDPRVVYRRTQTIGKGVALNEGLRLAKGALVVLTDDDCIAPPGWAGNMAKLFDARPQVAIVFCNVLPVPHDPRTGYVPTYERSQSRLITSLWGLRDGLGLGAGMAIRRDVAMSLGGFDESFGPGARFPSADEWDMAIRVLVFGWHIYETSDLSIVHDGFRSSVEGREHVLRDWIALGAVSAKPLRGGHVRAAVVPLYFYPAKALWPMCLDLLQFRRPRGLLRIKAYLRGFAEGMGTPMDPQSLKFRPRD
jgi:glycosyltransferase involved in cell wall biosynthesis